MLSRYVHALGFVARLDPHPHVLQRTMCYLLLSATPPPMALRHQDTAFTELELIVDPPCTGGGTGFPEKPSAVPGASHGKYGKLF